MKKVRIYRKIFFSAIIVTVFLGLFPVKSEAQIYELERLALDIEKLSELKSILTNLYKDFEILETRYTAIKNISEGNFNLHKAFLDGLLAVSPAVQNYVRVADIIIDQGRIVSEYKSAFNLFKQDKHFTPDELVYMSKVYDNLINKSEKNLVNLLNIITANKLRMNDAERIHGIDGIYRDTHDELTFLRQFNSKTANLSVARSKDEDDLQAMRNLYGQ